MNLVRGGPNVSSAKSSYRLCCRSRLLESRRDVALHWGSRSTTRTRWPSSPKAWARLQAAVVLPTPPLLLTIAMITPMGPSIEPGAVGAIQAYAYLSIFGDLKPGFTLQILL